MRGDNEGISRWAFLVRYSSVVRVGAVLPNRAAPYDLVFQTKNAPNGARGFSKYKAAPHRTVQTKTRTGPHRRILFKLTAPNRTVRFSEGKKKSAPNRTVEYGDNP